MKTKLARIIMILILVIPVTSCFAQQSGTVFFNYDANGNRNVRQIQIGGSKGDSVNHDNKVKAAIDVFESLSVELYPNPTEGRFCIVINKDAERAILQAVLMTAVGNVIYDKTVYSQTECFDLTGQPSGVYLLKLIVDSECHVWKIIKK